MRIPNLLWQDLQADKELGPVDRAVYLAAWIDPPKKMYDLAAKARVSRNTVTQSCATLAQRGWLALMKHGNKSIPVALIPLACQEQLAEALRIEYDMAVYRGEFLMRKYLDLRIATDDFIDNARPVFLTNPRTGERFEYDRFYLLGVGFEFNGPQHYARTKQYHDEKALRETKARDLMKKGLSMDAQVTIVVVTADRLHPAVLEELIPAKLPRRHIDTDGPYYRTLVELCKAYAGEARSWSAGH